MKTALLCLLLAMAPQPQPRGPERFTAAAIGPDGALVVTRADGQTRRIPKSTDQTAFQDPALSPDGTAAGAQAMYANCCTSYDIPLALVVYSNGRIHRFSGNALPIWKWRFEGEDGVAYSQTTVHGGCSDHYELRDIGSERLLDSTDVWQDAPNCPPPGGPPRMPGWAKRLMQQEPK